MYWLLVGDYCKLDSTNLHKENYLLWILTREFLFILATRLISQNGTLNVSRICVMIKFMAAYNGLNSSHILPLSIPLPSLPLNLRNQKWCEGETYTNDAPWQMGQSIQKWIK